MATTIENPPAANPTPDPKEDQLPGKQMSFLEHLEELRQRLLRAAVALLAGFGICFYFARNIYSFLARPMTQTLHQLGVPDKLVYNNPVDPFNLMIKLALMCGLFLASPFILWQLWLFVSPGLYRHEKKYVWPFVTLTTLLFAVGGYFAWALAFPAALKFLVGYGSQFQALITINEYWDLAISIIVAVGLVFELPVVILLLSIFGIVTPKFLWRQVRYAVLITAVVAAAIVPTNDMASIFIVWIPLVGLYILSIGLSWLVQFKKRRRDKQARAEAS
ncbi:MAG TPA: twin-arginine translocase subunit TatC [Terriglobia bacterium]|nr:twin-arginine translocase subunit TatC [Terriglobia bacterium]